MAEYSTIKPLVLYDIPSNESSPRCWGPNTAKTRFNLSYKRIPFTTQWVEYPSIAPTMESLGADPLLPVAQSPSDEPSYTLPVIYDPNHDKYVTDSFAIAQYLDSVYPTPGRELFPEGTAALQRAWEAAFTGALQKGLRAVYAGVPAKLNPPSGEYFARTRAKRFGVNTWEEISSNALDASDPSSRAAHLRELQAGLAGVEGWLKVSSGGGKWVMGDHLSWADVFLGAWLLWFSRVAEDWEEIKGWHGGRWGRFFDDILAESDVKLD
ncbi:hypothetical protein CONPUDRAFT_46993 [Coniophora puteana RWD-64-598 SS2]|uniref:GST N-terminal domain-containing protein n=1 Tax=Coniophora puteana (strain RWD-64-598) TaxID=741705 RepID=A0A5M3N044_CONPW|nr:uncharacterized protein CONPUDRAFT_46993 [Coniophora puteana RWD-64-598 SS2]EIW84770.1 hypothetical protein CONPUDRAFT_46993 [Coniophora puteana RWD-64-598 SS2]